MYGVMKGMYGVWNKSIKGKTHHDYLDLVGIHMPKLVYACHLDRCLKSVFAIIEKGQILTVHNLHQPSRNQPIHYE